MKLQDFGIRSKAKIRKSLYHFLENRCHQSRRANGRIIESVWMLEKIVQFHHHAVKMQRTEDGRKLIGELNIQ